MSEPNSLQSSLRGQKARSRFNDQNNFCGLQCCILQAKNRGRYRFHMLNIIGTPDMHDLHNPQDGVRSLVALRLLAQSYLLPNIAINPVLKPIVEPPATNIFLTRSSSRESAFFFTFAEQVDSIWIGHA